MIHHYWHENEGGSLHHEILPGGPWNTDRIKVVSWGEDRRDIFLQGNFDAQRGYYPLQHYWYPSYGSWGLESVGSLGSAGINDISAATYEDWQGGRLDVVTVDRLAGLDFSRSTRPVLGAYADHSLYHHWRTLYPGNPQPWKAEPMGGSWSLSSYTVTAYTAGHFDLFTIGENRQLYNYRNYR